MKKLFLGLIFILLISFGNSFAHTPDSYLNVTLILEDDGTYEADSYLNVTLILVSEAAQLSCATLVSGEWYVPEGCECYCEGESLNLNDCSCPV